MRVTWLADVLHAARLQLAPLDGWQGRGRELTTINGVVWHHTATPASSSDEAVARILRDGRSDLPGPLSQLGLDRRGRFWLIADGKCSHNGYGTWANQSIGIEAFNNGTGEPWSALQVDAWIRGTVAILRHLGFNEGHVLGHKETDPTRKRDPLGIDMPSVRRQIASLLRPPVSDPVYGPVYPEDDMQPIDIQIATDGQGHGYVDLAVDPKKVINVVFNTADPASQGYKPSPDWARLNVNGKARIVVEEAIPNGRVDATVWVAA